MVFSYNRPIGLYESTKVPPNSIGTFSGWGCTRVIGRRKEFPNELRSINVPIINEEDCQRLYNDFATITNENICTLDEDGKQSSCFGDSGAPLVVSGYLIGVMSWKKEGKLNPDVFVNVAHPNVRPWILSFLAKFKT
ncbi:trypsin-2-like [Belonocnema kinseyi]|uniref:trypsin-2-like n=1 Tax=Belonocnema kinseyi TaxID=2817044 RepID=UPI00143CE372|nr:trypsin-2-like [Belonocnema kinseyi]